MAPTFPGFFDQQDDPFSDFSSDFTGQGTVTPEPQQDSFSGAVSNGFLPQNYQDLIDKYAPQYGIPPDIAGRMVKQESGFNPSAVSNKGATGLLQIMPDTAQEEAGLQNMSGYDLKNPEDSTKLGFGFLSRMYKRYGDWAKALAAYNAGPGAVDKYGGVPPYKETQQYVSNILPSYSSESGGSGSNSSGGGGGAEATPVETTGQLPVNQPNFLPTTGGRDANIAALQNTAQKYRGMASDFLAQAKDSSMDKGQMWANVLTPTIGAALGGIMNGKKGAKMGAAAGFTGAGAGNAMAAAETKQKQEISAKQAQFAEQEAQKADQEAARLQSQSFAQQDKIDFKSRFGQMGVADPSAQEALVKLSQGQDITEDERASIMRSGPKAQTLMQQYDKINQIKDNHTDNYDLNKDKFQFNKQLHGQDSYNLSKPIVNPDTQRPAVLTTLQMNHVTDLNSSIPTILRNADNLAKNFEKYGNMNIGNKGVEMKQNLYAMFPAMRNFNSQGVRFNPFIKATDLAEVGDDQLMEDFWNTTFQNLTGVEAGQATRRFIAEMVKQYEDRLQANQSQPDWNFMKNQNPDLASLYAKYGGRFAGNGTDNNSQPNSTIATDSNGKQWRVFLDEKGNPIKKMAM